MADGRHFYHVAEEHLLVWQMVEVIYQLQAKVVTYWLMVAFLPFAMEHIFCHNFYHMPWNVSLPFAIYHLSTSPIYTSPSFMLVATSYLLFATSIGHEVRWQKWWPPNLPKTATRGPSWPICLNHPLGGVQGPFFPNQPPGALPDQAAQIGHQGVLPMQIGTPPSTILFLLRKIYSPTTDHLRWEHKNA